MLRALAALGVLPALAACDLRSFRISDPTSGAAAEPSGSPLFDEAVANVIPGKGFQSRIRLGDSVVDLVRHGVIDSSKLDKLYAERGGLPPELKGVLAAPSEPPIRLTKENAGFYVNLLWPLGLANFMAANERSPINTASLDSFASTGGWNLGREGTGGRYFNKFTVVALTAELEALAVGIAESSYRPCCDNSTFYQDCNHGSALLGLLELGASQGLAESELYREALAFNSFWFPRDYIYTALHFKALQKQDWDKVDPKAALGRGFSSASGSARIKAEVARIPDLIPKQRGGGESCAV